MPNYVVKWTETVDYWCEVDADTADEAVKVSERTSDNLIDNEVFDSGERMAILHVD